jgi:hypothetical protein
MRYAIIIIYIVDYIYIVKKKKLDIKVIVITRYETGNIL